MADICLLGTGGMMPLKDRFLTSIYAEYNGKAVLIDDQDEVIKWSRALCDKFPCTQEYIETEIEKDAPRTLLVAVDIEDMNGKLVHEA